MTGVRRAPVHFLVVDHETSPACRCKRNFLPRYGIGKQCEVVTGYPVALRTGCEAKSKAAATRD
jgi:hypothetical protein